jgi:hypothetical protein
MALFIGALLVDGGRQVKSEARFWVRPHVSLEAGMTHGLTPFMLLSDSDQDENTSKSAVRYLIPVL